MGKLSQFNNHNYYTQITIIDLANVTASHLMQFNLNFVKRISILNQDASPIRQKDFHFINPPPGFDTVLNMFKGIMSEKNKNKLMVSVKYKRNVNCPGETLIPFNSNYYS